MRFWLAAREAFAPRAAACDANALCRFVEALCAAGHLANVAALDGALLPRLAPAFERFVRAAERAAAHAERQTAAAGAAAYREGDVVGGVIQSLPRYGAFVALDGGGVGLLHISQISRARLSSPAEVFAEGERVKVLVLLQDASRGGRITLSTKRLEREPGDMVRDKRRVFDEAERTAEELRAKPDGVGESGGSAAKAPAPSPPGQEGRGSSGSASDGDHGDAPLPPLPRDALAPERVVALLPALAAFDVTPRPDWWRLYQAALLAAAPRVAPAALVDALEALAALRLPVEEGWAPRVFAFLKADEVAQLLSPERQAMLLLACGHLANAAARELDETFGAELTAALWAGAAKHVAALRLEGAERGEAEQEAAASGSGGDRGNGSSGAGAAATDPQSADDGRPPAKSRHGRGAPDTRDEGRLCVQLLVAGARLRRARAELGPPPEVLAALLAGARRAFGQPGVPGRALVHVALSAEVLGLPPPPPADAGARWLDALQAALEARLESLRAAELAQGVAALCALGARPRDALIARLLALGPVPDYANQPRLLPRLHAAVTALIDAEAAAGAASEAEASEAAAGGGPAAAGGKRGRKQRRPSAARPQWAEAAPPQEGADDGAFEAYVDAARAQLGASRRPEAEWAAAADGGASGEEAALAPDSPLARFAAARMALDDDASIEEDGG